MLLHWCFPFVHTPALTSFLCKTWVTVQLGPLFFVGFGGRVRGAARAEEAGVVLFGSAFLHLHTLWAPRSLPMSQRAFFFTQLPEKLAAVVPEGHESICLQDSHQSGMPSPKRTVWATSAICHQATCQGRGNRWLCGACPSVSSRSQTPSSFHSNILGHFQVKDWIPRS